MKLIWFRKVSWGYAPVSPMGFIITLLALAFMVPVIMAADRQAHSVTDELYQIFVYGTCTAFWWKWVADRTSI
ncbi:MAG: hypothetical protein U0X40_02670 [Ferruginibacter sp.]